VVFGLEKRRRRGAVWTWRFGTQYGGGVSSVVFAVRFDDLKDLFQPK